MANKANKTRKPASAPKKERKHLSPETKQKLKVGFGTIISNNCVVEAGRSFHWWIPLLLGLFSAILALVPNFVNGMKTDVGGSFIGSNTYGYENGLIHFGDYLEENKNTVSFTVENAKLKVAGWPADSWYTFSGNENGSIGDSDSQTVIVEPTRAQGFEVFYNNSEVTGIDDNEFRNRILKNCNPLTNTARTNNPDGNTSSTYRTHYLLFCNDYFVYAKYPRNTTTAGTSYIGYYSACENGFNFLSLFNLKEGTAKGSKKATEEIVENWKVFFRQSYESTKISSVWMMAGIMGGVNVGVILLFGFVIWLMTRGKNNPFRSVKVYEAFCMAGWASPSPALLALFGFLIPNFASFIFIFLYGIRVMWMSMRALRPYDVAPRK